MNKQVRALALNSMAAFSFAGCIRSKLGSANTKENVQMKIQEKIDVIDLAAKREQ